MKNIKIEVFLLMLFLMINVFSQDKKIIKKEITLKQRQNFVADKYIHGTDTEIDYAKAKIMYEALVAQNDTRAMNKLGVMYKNGLGVNQNNDSARYYFELASDLNNPKALFNLGLLYKNGDGVTQDFSKAFECFEKSLKYGNKASLYSLGYFYYKGLAVEQDYSKALEYFEKGSDVNIPACIYMKGFCYLKGYGTPQDTIIGKQLIVKAAQKGYEHAIDFITENRIEDALNEANMKTPTSLEIDSLIPKKIHRGRFKDKLNEKTIEGLWVGKLIVYDWSGKKIESEKKLELSLIASENVIQGLWIQDDTTSIELQAIKNDSLWLFVNSKFEKVNSRSWKINKGAFEIEEKGNATYLKGNIEQFNLNIKEPSKPAYMVLKKTKNRSAEIYSEDIYERVEKLIVYPNPFNQEITVKLQITDEQDGRFEVFDNQGKLIFSDKKTRFKIV